MSGEELSEGVETYMVKEILSDDCASFLEAIKQDKGKKVMDNEISLIKRPDFGIFKTKFNEFGEVDKYKTSL